MSQTTYTRTQLRKAICIELDMPFFRRYSSGVSQIDASSTVSKIFDTSLTQRNGFWNGHWFFGRSAGDVSLIRSFSSADKSFLLEVPMASTPTAGDYYEILSKWNPIDVHEAINSAIAEGARAFPREVEDEVFALSEDILTYNLSTLTRIPWRVLQVWIEDIRSGINATVASATNSTFVISEAASLISSVVSGWMVSIYSGTGAGQVRKITNVSSQTGTISVNWITNPDTTSKLFIWNPNEEINPWVRIDRCYTDVKEQPSNLYFLESMPQFYGRRIRIKYVSVDTPMELETDTTVIPKEYIKRHACHILHGKKISNTKEDADRHFSESKRYEESAELFKIKNAPRKPESYIPYKQGKGNGGYYKNPLDW